MEKEISAKKIKYVQAAVAIVGGGHMGSSLAEGLIRGGVVKSSQIFVADPTLKKVADLGVNMECVCDLAKFSSTHDDFDKGVVALLKERGHHP